MYIFIGMMYCSFLLQAGTKIPCTVTGEEDKTICLGDSVIFGRQSPGLIRTPWLVSLVFTSRYYQ